MKAWMLFTVHIVSSFFLQDFQHVTTKYTRQTWYSLRHNLFAHYENSPFLLIQRLWVEKFIDFQKYPLEQYNYFNNFTLKGYDWNFAFLVVSNDENLQTIWDSSKKREQTKCDRENNKLHADK